MIGVLNAISRLWPLVVLAICGIAVAIALLLPDGDPLMMSIAASAGRAVGSIDYVVILLALAFGLVIRHLIIALAIAALFGFLLQFFSFYGFHEDAAAAIAGRALGLLVSMAAVGIIPLAWRTVRRRRDPDASGQVAAAE